MVRTRNLKRALQNEALMHLPKNSQTNEDSIPRMARTRKHGRINRLRNVNQQEEVLVHHQESPRSDGYLSTLAKMGTYCPIDILDWRKVPKSNKNEMLGIVQSRFLGILGMDEWILQSIGRKWRHWKKDLKLKYFEPEMPLEYLVKITDERVIKEQWKGLLTFWLSEEGKKVSIRGKEARNKKKLNHITGRRSFAQIREDEGRKIGREPTRAETFNLCFPVEEEGEARQLMETMRGLINELDDPSQDVVSRNDVYSRANGPEKPGRLRTYGHGVTPTDLFEQIPSRRACYQMIQTLKERLDSVESRAAQQNKNDVSSHVDSGCASLSSYEQRISTLEINNPRPLRVNCSVSLLSIMDRKEIVAKGFLKNMDPSNQVGGQVLGKNYCEVHVNVAVKSDEDLIRPYACMQIIGDALGMSISWPISLVVRDED